MPEDIFETALEQQGERRRTSERRQLNLRTLICGATKGRRRDFRRISDRYYGGYVDRHEIELWLAVLGILVLSLTDAALTLTLLQKGAIELNTLMAVLINTDVQLFIASKLAITGLALMLLLIHAKFRIFRYMKVSFLIYFFLSLYTLLIAYELTLLAWLTWRG